MMSISVTREDVDKYFEKRPLKRYFLKQKGLLEEYYHNCINYPSRNNNVNYRNIDTITGPFIFRQTTRGDQWYNIERDYLKFKDEYGKKEY